MLKRLPNSLTNYPRPYVIYIQSALLSLRRINLLKSRRRPEAGVRDDPTQKKKVTLLSHSRLRVFQHTPTARCDEALATL